MTLWRWPPQLTADLLMHLADLQQAALVRPKVDSRTIQLPSQITWWGAGFSPDGNVR